MMSAPGDAEGTPLPHVMRSLQILLTGARNVPSAFRFLRRRGQSGAAFRGEKTKPIEGEESLRLGTKTGTLLPHVMRRLGQC